MLVPTKWYSSYCCVFRDLGRLKNVSNLINVKNEKRYCPGGRVSMSQDKIR